MSCRRGIAGFYSSLRRKDVRIGACRSYVEAASGPAQQAEALLDATIASVTIEGLLLSRSGRVRLSLDQSCD